MQTYQHRLKSGEIRDVEVRASPLESQDASTLNFAIVHDVTERRRAEAALRESETRFRTLFENSQDGVAIYERTQDGRLKLLECNKSFVAMSGRSMSQLLEAPDINAFRTPVNPNLHSREIFRATPDDGAVTGQYAWKRPDGAENVVEYKGVPVAFRDSIYIYGVERDMTEFKRTERALRESERNLTALLDATSQMVLLYEVDGRLLALNEPAARFLGGDPQELVGDNIADHFPAEMEAKRQARVEEAIRSRRSQTFREPHPGGRLLEVTLHPVLDRHGEPSRMAVYASDITEQVEMERQLQQAQKMEALGALAGGIAHDFNNVLGVILANAELVKSRLKEQPVLLRKMERVHEAALRARGVVRQILTFSRRGEAALERIDLAQTLRESRLLLRNALPSSIRITVDAPRGSVIVRADPNQIHQVLLNLAANARDAMAPGGGRLILSLQTQELLYPDLTGARRQLPPGRYALLEVQDSGEGIPPNVIDRCVEPFFTTKPVGKGTGLGLSVVHGIVTKSGGAMEIHSQPGDGTTVLIHLPLAEGGIHAKKLAAASRPGPARILVAEDEEDLLRAMKTILLEEGHEVATAPTAAGALTLMENGPPADLIITDQTMPGLSGVELARRVWREHPDLPVLLCTGYTDDGVEGFPSQGRGRTLLKPFTREELMDCVHELLSRTHGQTR